MAERTVDLIIRARDNASKAFTSLNGALENLTGIQQRVARGADLMSKALSGSEADALSLQKALNDGSALRARDGFRALGQAVERMRGDLQRQRAEVEETGAAYNALRAQARNARAAIDRLQGRIGPMSEEEAAKVKTLERALRSLSREIERSGRDWSEQTQALEEAENRYNRMEAAAGLTEAALRRLRAEQNAATGGTSAADQERLTQSFREAAAASRLTAAEQERLSASFREGESNLRAWINVIGRAVRETREFASAAGTAEVGVGRLSGRVMTLRSAFGAFYGDSRRALSLMQRMRGEVLSLTAAFVGFYGVFEQGSQVLTAFRSVEAATNRLGAALDGDTAAVRRELAFLRAEAERLGVSFDVLATNYSSFLISGQQAGLDLADIRNIFRQVTEAGRVMGLSNERIERTFTALTQIAGKGTAQMEELRQQLGDNIPGAIGIIARQLGYTERTMDQFYDRVEAGALNAEDALRALGDGLEETFGDQLDAALQNVNTKIGRLQDLLFQRRLTVANSGFIAGLETALDALNGFLASDAGIQFFERLGVAAGRFFELLPGILDNLDRLGFALQALIALKISQTIRSLAASFAPVAGATAAMRQSMLAFNASLYAVSPAAARAMVSTTALGAALRGLRGVAAAAAVGIRTVFAALGGWLGIVVTALSFVLTGSLVDAATRIDEFNSVIMESRNAADQVAAAYQRAAEGADGWADSLSNLTELEVADLLRRARNAYREFMDEARDGSNPAVVFAAELSQQVNRTGVGGNAEQEQALRDLLRAREAFESGGLSAEAYQRAVLGASAALAELAEGPAQDLLDALVDQAEQAVEGEEAIARLEAALAVMRGEATAAQRELLGLSDATEQAGNDAETAAARFDTFREAMRNLSEFIPELAAQLDILDRRLEIETSFQNALTAARALPDAIMRAAAEAEALQLRDQALGAIDLEQVSSINGISGSDSVEVAASLLRDREGFRATPYWDVNAYRVGYGSDTITLADGTIQQVVQGTRISVEDANRDLIRRITTEFMPQARRQTGEERFDSFNPQQQAALTSIAYNYGSLPDRIIEAVRTGTDEEIAAAIRGLGGDNDGINRNRRNLEAALFSSPAGEQAGLELAEERLEAERRLAEQREEFNQDLEQSIANQEFENSLIGQRTIEAEVARALREAELEAQALGLELTQQQREDIERTTRARYAQQQVEEDRNAQLEEARRLEEEVTRLQERRRFLQEELEYAQGQGDSEMVAELETELANVTEALDEATERALAFWQAIGGEGSEAAIQGLQQTQAEMRRTAQVALTTGEEMNRMFADRLTSAIDRFAQRVANGENAWTAFKEEFLRAAGEILIQIAQMIIRQAIFNALSGGMAGGGAGGFVAGAVNGLFHAGGIAGRPTATRTVDPAIFANAVRYHVGGVAGLRPGEVPAILEEGEEILTENNPRHARNGGGSGGGSNIINAFDAPGFLDAALAMPEGKDAILNFVRANPESFKAAME